MMKLKDVLVAYKQNFVSKQWGDEKYKWEAVKWFQDNWDVNASDFAEMLARSLDKTFNLLASNNNFPKGMIVGFAKAAPEEVRSMFIALFDESKDVFERMDAFKTQSSVLARFSPTRFTMRMAISATSSRTSLMRKLAT